MTKNEIKIKVIEKVIGNTIVPTLERCDIIDNYFSDGNGSKANIKLFGFLEGKVVFDLIPYYREEYGHNYEYILRIQKTQPFRVLNKLTSDPFKMAQNSKVLEKISNAIGYQIKGIS